MANPATPASIALLRRRIRAAGLTQQQIASAVDASQSQVSRVLSGHSSFRSRLYDRICIYVSSAVSGVTPDSVRQNAELIDALAEVWDGSPDHAQALSTVIRAMALLTPSRHLKVGG